MSDVGTTGGAGFAAVGAADPVVGGRQDRYPGLRPVLFHSPYEVAVSFLIGHRISIAQGRAIRRRFAEERGVGLVDTATELMHVWFRSDAGGPARTRRR